MCLYSSPSFSNAIHSRGARRPLLQLIHMTWRTVPAGHAMRRFGSWAETSWSRAHMFPGWALPVCDAAHCPNRQCGRRPRLRPSVSGLDAPSPGSSTNPKRTGRLRPVWSLIYLLLAPRRTTKTTPTLSVSDQVWPCLHRKQLAKMPLPSVGAARQAGPTAFRRGQGPYHHHPE